MEGPVCSVVLCFSLFCFVEYFLINRKSANFILFIIILLLSPLFHLRSFLFFFWVQKSSCLED